MEKNLKLTKGPDSPERIKGNSVNEYLKDHNIDAPPIEFKIGYTSHSTEKDANFLEKGIVEADVFLPEFYDLNESEKTIITEIASGKLQVEQIPDGGFKDMIKRSPFQTRLLKILENSHKEVLFVDIPREHELADKLVDFSFKISTHLNLLKKQNADFEKAIQVFKDDAKGWADLQWARESYIQSRIPEEFERLLREQPELLKKKTIKAFAFFGSFHTNIYHQMKESGNSVSRDFPHPVTTYSLGTQVSRASFFNKEIMEEDLARVILEDIISSSIKLSKPFANYNLKTEKWFDYKRMVVEKFSLEEIKELYEIFKGLSKEDFGILLDEKIRTKGLLPMSEWLAEQDSKE